MQSYGFSVGIAIVLCTVLSALICRRRARTILCALGWAVPVGLVFSRLTWCLVNYNRYILYDPSQILKIKDGGLSLWGGFIAAYITVMLFARIKKQYAMGLLEALTPGTALFIALVRGAEVFTAQGVGREIQWAQLNGSVLSMLDPIWQDNYRFAVYRYEAVLAVIVFIAALILYLSGREAFVPCAGALAAFQIVFEMLRDDDYMFIFYFRISQILCALILLALFIYGAVRARAKKRIILCFILFAAGVGLAIKQDFAVDSVKNLEISYLIMLAGALMVYAAVLAVMVPGKRTQSAAAENATGGWALAGAIVILACAVFCAFMFTSGGWAASIPYDAPRLF